MSKFGYHMAHYLTLDSSGSIVKHCAYCGGTYMSCIQWDWREQEYTCEKVIKHRQEKEDYYRYFGNSRYSGSGNL